MPTVQICGAEPMPAPVSVEPGLSLGLCCACAYRAFEILVPGTEPGSVLFPILQSLSALMQACKFVRFLYWNKVSAPEPLPLPCLCSYRACQSSQPSCSKQPPTLPALSQPLAFRTSFPPMRSAAGWQGWGGLLPFIPCRLVPFP